MEEDARIRVFESVRVCLYISLCLLFMRRERAVIQSGCDLGSVVAYYMMQSDRNVPSGYHHCMSAINSRQSDRHLQIFKLQAEEATHDW